MLIVHSQSSIKFNSHSASTCYSNSVTEDTSGMCSYFSLTSLLFFIHNDIPILPLSPPPPPSFHWHRGQRQRERESVERICKYHRRSGAYVCISHEANQHLIIKLSPIYLLLVSSSLLSSPLLVFFFPFCQNSSRFRFSLSLSPLLLPANALRLSTLFPL